MAYLRKRRRYTRRRRPMRRMRKRTRVASKKGIKKVVKKTIATMAERKVHNALTTQQNQQLPHDLEWVRMFETISRGSEESQRIGKDIYINYVKIYYWFKNKFFNYPITVKCCVVIDKTPTVGMTGTNSKFFESEASNYDPLDFVDNFSPAGTGAPGSSKVWLMKSLNRKRFTVLKTWSLNLGPSLRVTGPAGAEYSYTLRMPEKMGHVGIKLNRKITFDDTTSGDLGVLPSIKLLWWYEMDQATASPAPGALWTTIDTAPFMDHSIRIKTIFRDM